MTDPRRILVIQTAFLGDLVLTLPLIDAVRSQWKEAKVAALVERSAAGLLEEHPSIDKILTFSKRESESKLYGMIQIIKRLRSLKCDLALIPHRSFRSALIAFLAGIPQRVGFLETPGALLYTDRVFRDPDQHEYARNLALLHPFGAGTSPQPPVYNPPESAVERVDSWLSEHRLDGSRFAAFAPGSIWATKRWLVENWIQLARSFVERDIPVVVVGGGEDRGHAVNIANKAGDKTISAAGELSIPESAELLRRAMLLVSGDTAPVHLACAVKTTVLALFGPTVPDFGFAPTGTSDRVIGLEMECRPCAIHGSDSCPLEHHKCMKDLSPESVFQAALEILNAGSGSNLEQEEPSA